MNPFTEVLNKAMAEFDQDPIRAVILDFLEALTDHLGKNGDCHVDLLGRVLLCHCKPHATQIEIVRLSHGYGEFPVYVYAPVLREKYGDRPAECNDPQALSDALTEALMSPFVQTTIQNIRNGD